MLYASSHLHPLREAGEIDEFFEQPQFQLGEDTRYRADFGVVAAGCVWAVDVKGVETREFKRIKRLWAKYARIPLHVVKRKGKRFVTVEIITSSAASRGGSTTRTTL